MVNFLFAEHLNTTLIHKTRTDVSTELNFS